MDEKVVRLINILQDRFDVPSKTEGENILMTYPDLEAEVDSIWPKGEDNWDKLKLEQAIAEFEIPNYVSFYGVRTFILVRK